MLGKLANTDHATNNFLDALQAMAAALKSLRAPQATCLNLEFLRLDTDACLTH
jgi:hypothetical protein